MHQGDRAGGPGADVETLFRALFESSAEGVLVTRADGTIARANPAACRMLRRGEDELRRLGRSQLVVDDESLRNFLAERQRDGVARGILTHLRPDGSTSSGTTGAGTSTELLEITGHEVWLAGDGRSAVALAVHHRPDVIICDIGLPDISGYEVAKMLRGDRSLAGTRLVALTGYAQPEDKERARQAGFDAHLAKPPSLEALDAVIAEGGGP